MALTTSHAHRSSGRTADRTAARHRHRAVGDGTNTNRSQAAIVLGGPLTGMA